MMGEVSVRPQASCTGTPIAWKKSWT
jgi:hypothetical protein